MWDEGNLSNTVYLDSNAPDGVRRDELYSGQLFAYSIREPVAAFARFTRQLIEEAFAPLDPPTAQYHMPVEGYAELLGRLKPAFIHHPESRRHIQRMLEDFGCDLERTYFDLPRLRSSTSDRYLTTGIAYAWHAHRDTWYSAPRCQVNWWMPVYELAPDNGMAFHPACWSRAVENDSERYNYYEWNRFHRGPAVVRMVGEDPRPLPRVTGSVDLHPQLRAVCPVGGIIAFSAAHLHSSVPNNSGKTRFSVDFRVVNVDDARARRGAPWTDERCTGTSMRDFRRASDFAPMPDDVVALYDDGTAAAGDLVYTPAETY